MRSTMQGRAAAVTSRLTDSGHDPILRDIGAELAARAHTDAEPDDRAAAARHGKHPRSWCRARAEGPSEARAFGRYLMNTGDPFRWLAWAKAIVKRNALKKLSRPELIERYLELRPAEKQREAADTILDLDVNASWLDRAAASERDAALDEECAAIERRFAELRVTPAEVFGGSC